jgi:hypothetical protein
VFYRPALLGVSVSAIRRTHPSWLWQGRSGLPLPTIHGPRIGQCKVSMMIPLNPTEPWSGSVVGSKPNTDVEMMAHITLTSLCEDCLTGTAVLPSALLPIQNQENPVWQQRLEVVSDLEGPHLHTWMISLARYAPYLFNLQHNTARTGIQQCTHLMAYEESAIATAREVERLRHENAILHSGARPPSEQDHEL